MFLRPVLWAGICVSFATPALAEPTSAEVLQQSSSTLAAAVDQTHDNGKLAEFIRRIWSDSPAVRAAQAVVDAARARSDGALKPLHNPVLGIDAERTDVSMQTIGLTQTIDWSEKGAILARIANQDVRSANALLQKARQDVATETLATLARYYTAKEARDLSARGSRLMSEFVALSAKRHAAGDINALDQTLAQVAYSEALMAQAVRESELSEAEAALQGVSGMTLTQWPQLPSDLIAPPRDFNKQQLEQLPELIVLQRAMDAAKQRVTLAEREGRIDPSFGIRAGRDDSETLVGLSIEIPLFVRNNYSSNVKAAFHDVVVEEMAYREAYRKAHARLVGALGRFKNVRRAWGVWLENGQLAQREQMRLLETMGRTGELSATDFLVQAKQNIETQAAATELEGQVWQAAAEWMAAAGEIEQWLGLSASEPEIIDIETKVGESE